MRERPDLHFLIIKKKLPPGVWKGLKGASLYICFPQSKNLLTKYVK